MVRAAMGRRRILAALLALIALAGAAVVAPATPASVAARAGVKHDSGPYAVGIRSYTFVDTSRPTPPNGTYPGASTRTLPTLLLYPATGDPSGPAIENAAPIRQKRHGFPVIVFSHGFTAVGPAYRVLLEMLAREGYVIAAPTFPLSSAGAPGGPTIADYVNQPADVSFVLTRVLRLARERHSDLRRVVNGHRIGVAGHSLGAMTTLGVATNSCCLDLRIDAAVAWSGLQLPFPGGGYYSRPTPPLLLIHGNADRTVPYQGSVNAYDQAPAPKAFVTLEQGPHVPFFAPWLEPTIRSTTDFLDGFLKHDRKALERLATDGNVPGAASLQEDLGS